MIVLSLFREQPELVAAGLDARLLEGKKIVEQVRQLDAQIRKLRTQIEQMTRALKNLGEKGKTTDTKQTSTQHKQQYKELQQQLRHKQDELQTLLVCLPNILHERVPAGKTATDNQCVKQHGQIYSPAQKPLAHWDIAHTLRLIDFEAGTKVSGTGFPFFRGQGAKLARAIISFCLDENTAAGYVEYNCPILVNEHSVHGTGQLPDKDNQMYRVPLDGLYLIPTAEVPLSNIYRDTILAQKDLPLKLTGYTPCFRREAGNYGKHTRGLNRLHQFDKVEIVQFTRPTESLSALDEMVSHVEILLQKLQLPYRIMLLCTGDTGFSSAITYDFEVYSPAQQQWLEVSSVSCFSSFQTNRMKTRMKNANAKTELLHSLNGSALALPRVIACLLENHQYTENGQVHVRIPDCLQPYFGTDKISSQEGSLG